MLPIPRRWTDLKDRATKLLRNRREALLIYFHKSFRILCSENNKLHMFGKYRCTIINVRKSVCDQPSNDKEEAQTQFSNFLTSQAKPLHSGIVKEILRTLFCFPAGEVCSCSIIRTTWSFFFGRQKRRFSVYYRTK